jgi:hypothetical protein
VARLDGQQQTAQTFWLNPNPQADNSVVSVKIELENKGDVPLRVDALEWASETPQIALEYYDAALGPADFPYQLAPYTTLTLAARWTTTPALDGQAAATLTVRSNDPKTPELVLTVLTPCTDAKAALAPTAVTIFNAGPYNAKIACTALANLGCKALTVQQVTLKPGDPRFSLVAPPPPGATIDPWGYGDNPKGAPKKLPICVRFEPKDEAQQPASVQLVVDAQGASAQQVQAQIKAGWSPPSGYRLACGGAQLLDLGPGPGGVASCKLQNDGPAPLRVAKLWLAPGTAAVSDAELAAAYSAELVQGGPQQAPWTLAAGAVAELRVQRKAGAAAPPAVLRAALEQDSEVDALAIPVLAGACEQPALAVGPAPATFLAKPGQQATLTITLANQSCAPLAIVDGCLTDYQVSQDDACATGAPSQEYGVAAALTQTLPPWGLASVDVTFAPLAPQPGKLHYGQLHLYWCRGLIVGGACQGTVEKRSVQLEGNSQLGLTPPKLTPLPVVGAKAGQALWLKAKVQPGSQPIGAEGAFQWWVALRTQGSAAWFAEDVSAGAVRRFVPDLPGTYQIAVRAAAFTPGELLSQSESPPALFTVVVGK